MGLYVEIYTHLFYVGYVMSCLRSKRGCHGIAKAHAQFTNLISFPKVQILSYMKH